MANLLVRVFGVGTMTTTLAIAAAACASASASAPPKLQSNWIFIANDGDSGTALDIKGDNTYVLARFASVSSNVFDSQVQTGTVSVAGSTITFVATNSSCRYPADPPSTPPTTATYNINGDELTVAFSFGVIVFKLNNATSGSGTSTGLVLTNGCFQDDGSFVPTPISPIGSCMDKPGSACSATSACCRGTTCVSDGVCAGTCTKNSDCKSGCCPVAVTREGLRGCGPATACK